MYNQQIDKLAGIIEKALKIAKDGLPKQTPIVAMDIAEKAARIMKNLEQAEQIHVENAKNRAIAQLGNAGGVRFSFAPFEPDAKEADA